MCRNRDNTASFRSIPSCHRKGTEEQAPLKAGISTGGSWKIDILILIQPEKSDMDEDRTYFFRPRVGKYYKDGFNGYRTLVLGQYLYCWRQSCIYRDKCTIKGLSHQLDLLCPLYSGMEDREYYRLSNSNIIEVDSYLEGNDYSAFSAFTHCMLGQKEHLPSSVRKYFWDRVAFYNYIQHYFPDPEIFEYNVRKNELDRYFTAFVSVVAELRPEVIYVWGDALKRMLEEHSREMNGVELNCVRQFDAGFVSVWIFTAGYGYGKPILSGHTLAGNDLDSGEETALPAASTRQRKKKQKRWFVSYLSGHPVLRGKLVYDEVTAGIAQELWTAQNDGIIQVDFCHNGKEVIFCPNPDSKDIIDLIDRIYMSAHRHGSLTCLLKYPDIMALLGVKPSNLYQKLHRLRSGKRKKHRKKSDSL